MPSRELIDRFVRMVEDGKFVEAMETFYAPDATMQENNEPPRAGLPALLAHERRTLETSRGVEGRSIGPPLIDGERVVIHWQFTFRQPTGAVVRFEELALQAWRGDKLASERFFYDTRQMKA
jgi:hypothetical protein